MSSSDADHCGGPISMRKSVENLVMSSQDAIGQSISQALSFSGVVTQHAASSSLLYPEHRSTSRSPSPCRRQLDPAPAIAEGPDDDKGAGADSVSVGSGAEGAGGAGAAGRGARKKKSWYSALYPTYKSRSDDFKRIFKDLPDDERLIVDYSCALQKDILMHGRLYASQSFLCFYANILGWETTLSLRWKDVTAITKEKTALVIPNAIVVSTETERNFLTSFSGRDKAYLMLFRVWQNALMDQQMSSQDMWDLVRSCYGEELGFASDDDEAARDADDDKMAAGGVEELLDGAGEVGSRFSLPAGGAAHAHPLARSVSQPAPAAAALDPPAAAPALSSGTGSAAEAGDALPTDMSDTSDSDRDKSPARAEAGARACEARCGAAHAGRRGLQLEVPVNIDQLFTMLFTNSKFCLQLLASRSTTDYIQSVWKHDAETGLKCRQVSYTLALAQPIGPKCVHVTETQVMNKCSKPGQLYSIDISSENAGVPYADSFYVVTHYCLQRRADTRTALQLYSSIQYKKSVWGIVKGFIEKNTWSGIEDYCRLLESALLRDTDDRALTKRKPKRRRRRPSLSPERGGPGGAVTGVGAGAAAGSAGPGGAPHTRWLAGALALLLLLNLLLYWKLYHAPPPHRPPHTLPETAAWAQGAGAEWGRLVQNAPSGRRDQLRAWRHALHQAIVTLRQAEEALGQLLDSIKPSQQGAPPAPPRGDL